ncbi:hypothetical protein GCM10010466_64030 [Planomonospora alba]|uniref:Uncharacterized protein n=1 Tax=Planomonospora alba TaxID=161354 RepID=A0ABP6P1B0_9ACTN
MVRADLSCPVCGGTEFGQEETTYDGRFEGRRLFLTSQVITLMICVGCRHILHFYGKRDDVG